MAVQMNIKIEEDLKTDVDNIFNRLGLSATDAVRIFFKKVQVERGIPFEMKLDYEPNKETKKDLICGEYEEVKDINELWK